MSWAAGLQRLWYAQRRPLPALWFLLPVHALFVLLSGMRRLAYRLRLLRSQRLAVPVVVVGNLVVGGAGKTPLVLWLAQELQRRGRSPALLSRGYGGSARKPQAVRSDSAASEVGDEALLLAQRSALPVWVGADRVAAGRALLAAHPAVDVLISDDGLQHYRLERAVELVVFDDRSVGNGWRLPLGPLREPVSRLRGVTALIFNGQPRAGNDASFPLVPRFNMYLEPGRLYRLGDPEQTAAVEDLQGRPVHALAGIGHPDRFFRSLREAGLSFVPHPFPDHHPFTAGDLDFGPGSVLLMTEKDAVKCAGLMVGEAWVLPVWPQLPAQLVDLVLERLNGP